MRIGLNATCLTLKPSGARHRFVGIYGDLVKSLPDVEFVVYEPKDCRVCSWMYSQPNVIVKRTPLSGGRFNKFLLGLGYWRYTLPREKFVIFEGFNLPLVKSPTGRTVLTIHDIRGLRPESGYLERTAYSVFLENSLRAADHVVTVSHAIKRDILDLFPEIPVSVIYNGLDVKGFAAITELELHMFRCKYGLPERFLLAVGHLERRKNYLFLIDAMARLRDRGSDCNLLIVGNDNGERKVIEERIESANLAGSVTILSGLTDIEVRCAYKLCSLFVFPSLYEGFGIPVLEAMAAGRPIVLSDIPVFREITQDRGVYFHPDDVESITASILTVLSSGAVRENLIAYGRERVKAFSFQNLSAQLASLYRSLS